MQKVYHWFQKEIPVRKLPSYLLGATFLYLFLTTISISILDHFSAPLPELLTPADILWFTPLILIVTSFVEELVFRGPLYFKKLQSSPLRLTISTMVLSLLFGFLHGTVFNIAIQGLCGIIMSALFLKGGGMQRKFWRGLALTTLTHAFIDSILWSLFATAILTQQQ